MKMDVIDKLRMLHKTAENLASDLPTEEMFLRFSMEVIDAISGYIEEIECL